MRWYAGGIAEGVTLSRTRNSIFVVYIEGKDDKSSKLTKIINTDEVSKMLEGDSFVAIKIEANSVPHQQFSEIYKQVNVPSVYFIGKTGVPLEIIEEATDTSEFLQKINDILKKNGNPVGTSPSTKQKVTSDFILQEKESTANSEIVNTSKSGDYGAASTSKSEVGAAGTSKPDVEAASTDKLEECITASETPLTQDETCVAANPLESTNSTESEISPEEKVERAKALIEKKRQEKQQEEDEKEKNKEIERRKVGQDVQKMKKWQQDQELKNVIEEREKERKEQQAARQRILAQIEQDKADRAARFSTSPQPSQSSPQSTSQPVPRVPTNSNVARLQFKLPDGSSHMHEFSSSSTLAEVRNYIKSNLKLSFNNFVLATTFPRREFSSDDDANTLLELELVPTAVVLILPVAHGTVASNPATFSTFLWSLIAPLLGIFGYLRNIVFGGPKPPPRESSAGVESKRPFETTAESSRQLPKRRAGETSVIRRQGNVHRLTDKTDSDDENNTWNGNSTQQM